MSFLMLMLTKFELKDIFIPILTTKGLISNFKKHNDETRITLKLKDFLRIFHYLFNSDLLMKSIYFSKWFLAYSKVNIQ